MKTKMFACAAILALHGAAFAGGEGWSHDFEAAKKQAASEKKDLLMDFTGSDWCGWCIKLEKEVLSQKAFKDFAAQNLILMEADFPKKKELPADLKKQNEALKKQYLNGGYPTIYLVDAEGKKLSEDLGELKGGTDAYIAKLNEIIAKTKK